MLRKIALTALAVLLSGCANIQTINGVRMNATTAPDATYCDRNLTMCILFGAALVGGLGALFAGSISHHHAPAQFNNCNVSGTGGGHSCIPQ